MTTESYAPTKEYRKQMGENRTQKGVSGSATSLPTPGEVLNSSSPQGAQTPYTSPFTEMTPMQKRRKGMLGRFSKRAQIKRRKMVGQ